MYIRERENGYEIVQQLPNKFSEDGFVVAGGFEKLPPEVHEIFGYYLLVTPEIDHEIEKLGEIYMPAGEDYYTYRVEPLSAYEIAMKEWESPEHKKRIVAPVDMLFDPSGIGIQMKGWFDLNNLPVMLNGNMVRLYCNEILPQHQAIADQYGELITIEERPIEDI